MGPLNVLFSVLFSSFHVDKIGHNTSVIIRVTESCWLHGACCLLGAAIPSWLCCCHNINITWHGAHFTVSEMKTAACGRNCIDVMVLMKSWYNGAFWERLCGTALQDVLQKVSKYLTSRDNSHPAVDKCKGWRIWPRSFHNACTHFRTLSDKILLFWYEVWS